MSPYGNGYPQAWYQTPYNPHVYLPPQYPADQYHSKPSGWHLFDRSPKYPDLNPALASDTTHIRYDLRTPPRDGILLSTYQQIALTQVIAPPIHEFRIVSKAFPWTVDIRAPTGSYVTCSAIFEALYAMLQEPIADSEWGIVMHDKSKRETIEKAAKARQEKERTKDHKLKRIDWLGETTAFKGLEHDEEFEKKRLLPGSQACAETWLIKFGKP